MRSQLFSFKLAQPVQSSESPQDAEMTYDVDAQMWVGGNNVIADNDDENSHNDDGDQTNLSTFLCTTVWQSGSVHCVLDPNGCKTSFPIPYGGQVCDEQYDS